MGSRLKLLRLSLSAFALTWYQLFAGRPWTMCLGAGNASDSQGSQQYPNTDLDRNKITDLWKIEELQKKTYKMIVETSLRSIDIHCQIVILVVILTSPPFIALVSRGGLPFYAVTKEEAWTVLASGAGKFQ